MWQRNAAADSSGCASSAAACVDGPRLLMYTGCGPPLAAAVDQARLHMEPTSGQLEPARATYAANPGPAGASRAHIRSQLWASRCQLGPHPQPCLGQPGQPGPHLQAFLGQPGAQGRRSGGYAARLGPAGASGSHIRSQPWASRSQWEPHPQLVLGQPWA